MTHWKEGTVVEGFVLKRRLHWNYSGGEDVLWEAEQESDGAEVVVRLFEDEDPGPLFTDLALRIPRGREHLITVHRTFRARETLGIVMERFVGAVSLHDYIERNPAGAVADTYEVLRQMLLGVDALHANGVVHRALDPKTVLLAADSRPGHVHVKIANYREAALTTQKPRPEVRSMPEYVPDSIRTRSSDPRNDLYSCGAIALQLLDRDAFDEWINSEHGSRSLDLLQPLGLFLQNLVADDIEQRPKSAGEALRELERFRPSKPPIAAPPSPSEVPPRKGVFGRVLLGSTALLAVAALAVALRVPVAPAGPPDGRSDSSWLLMPPPPPPPPWYTNLFRTPSEAPAASIQCVGFQTAAFEKARSAPSSCGRYVSNIPALQNLFDAFFRENRYAEQQSSRVTITAVWIAALFSTEPEPSASDFQSHLDELQGILAAQSHFNHGAASPKNNEPVFQIAIANAGPAFSHGIELAKQLCAWSNEASHGPVVVFGFHESRKPSALTIDELRKCGLLSIGTTLSATDYPKKKDQYMTMVAQNPIEARLIVEYARRVGTFKSIVAVMTSGKNTLDPKTDDYAQDLFDQFKLANDANAVREKSAPFLVPDQVTKLEDVRCPEATELWAYMGRHTEYLEFFGKMLEKCKRRGRTEQYLLEHLIADDAVGRLRELHPVGDKGLRGHNYIAKVPHYPCEIQQYRELRLSCFPDNTLPEYAVNGWITMKVLQLAASALGSLDTDLSDTSRPGQPNSLINPFSLIQTIRLLSEERKLPKDPCAWDEPPYNDSNTMPVTFTRVGNHGYVPTAQCLWLVKSGEAKPICQINETSGVGTPLQCEPRLTTPSAELAPPRR